MEKKNKVVNKKINLSYIVFIKKLVDEKIVVDEKNKNKIEEIYSDIVKLEFNNIKRVNSRMLRENVREKLNFKLNENNLKFNEYKNMCEKVIKLSGDRGDNYF